MNLQSVLGVALVLLIGSVNTGVTGELSAREVLEKANQAVVDAPFVLRTDVSEQKAVLFLGGKKIEQPQKSEARIEIDRDMGLARQSGQVNGQDLVMIRRGRRTAMKLGSEPWQIPTGSFERMAEDMGNLFVCEREVPETEENAPKLRIAGTESIDGIEAIVIETEGNSAVALAEARMNKGAEKVFSSAGLAKPPSMKVLEYSSKMWVSKTDYRRLQTVQTSRVRISTPIAEGQEQIIESSGKSTSKYSYQSIAIDVPEDAKKILSRN